MKTESAVSIYQIEIPSTVESLFCTPFLMSLRKWPPGPCLWPGLPKTIPQDTICHPVLSWHSSPGHQTPFCHFPGRDTYFNPQGNLSSFSFWSKICLCLALATYKSRCAHSENSFIYCLGGNYAYVDWLVYFLYRGLMSFINTFPWKQLAATPTIL